MSVLSDLSTYKVQKYLGKLQSVSSEHPQYQIYLSKYMYWLEGGGQEFIINGKTITLHRGTQVQFTSTGPATASHKTGDCKKMTNGLYYYIGHKSYSYKDVNDKKKTSVKYYFNINNNKKITETDGCLLKEDVESLITLKV